MTLDAKLTTGIAYVDDITMRRAIAGVATGTNNDTTPDLDGNRILKIASTSSCSIATITGCVAGMPFTILKTTTHASMSAIDGTYFKLAGNWNGGIDDNITLVWDGTTYFELSRAGV